MIPWIQKHRWEVLGLVLLIALTLFLRFYRLADYMTFLGDEGRDAVIAKKILTEHILPSIGPPTSVGNIYLGPLYYYMMAVAMGLWWLNPVGPAAMVALIGTATVLLVYYLGRKWFGVGAAFTAAFTYSLSAVIIFYSRSSWNPNPAPFFTLLGILGFYKAYEDRNFLWFILSGAALSAAIQMHYLALILLPIWGILWLREAKSLESKKHFLVGTLGAIAAFVFLILPLILFDFRHDFLNYRAMTVLFSGGGPVGFGLVNVLLRSWSIYQDSLIFRYLGGVNTGAALVLSGLVLIPLVVAVKKRLSGGQVIPWSCFTLGIWLLVGLLGLTLYRGEIYDHYLGFLNPVPFLLLGGLVALIKNRWQMFFAGVLILFIGALNYSHYILFSPPNQQLDRTQKVARFIIDQSGGKPFNFALLAKSNYDAAYQYYLDLYGHKPKVVHIEITDQLWVVCEDEVCQPVGHAKYEIAAFGWAKIESESDVYGVRIFKLVANPSGKPS